MQKNLTYYQRKYLQIVGRHNCMLIEDLIKIFQYDQKNLSKTQKQARKTVNFRFNAIFCVGIGLNIIIPMILARIFPVFYSGPRIQVIPTNFSLMLLLLTGSFFCGLKFTEKQTKKVKRQFILNHDKQFMQHLRILNNKWGIPFKQQLIHVLNKQEYEEWSRKRQHYTDLGYGQLI